MPAPRTVRESVSVLLHQTDLSTLHDLGVVEYDRDRSVVALVLDAVCGALIAAAVVVVASAHRYSEANDARLSLPGTEAGVPEERPGD